MEERNGTILTVTADKLTGTLKDDSSGDTKEFQNPAVLDIFVGDGVVYVSISTPKGEVNIVKKLR